MVVIGQAGCRANGRSRQHQSVGVGARRQLCGGRACDAALRPGGVVAVWSAGPNARFERKLRGCAFEVEVLHVPARIGSRAKHVLFIAKRVATS